MAKNSALEKIQKRAKKIRTKNMTWIQAIKKASEQLKREGQIGGRPKRIGKAPARRKRVGAVKRRENKSTPVKKTRMVKRSKRLTSIGSIGNLALAQLNAQMKLLRDVEGKKESLKKRILAEREKKIKLEMKKELLSIDILIGIIKKNIRLIKGRVK